MIEAFILPQATTQLDMTKWPAPVRLRYVQDSRFGRLVAVDGTNKAFATIDDAVAFAKSQRTRCSHDGGAGGSGVGLPSVIRGEFW